MDRTDALMHFGKHEWNNEKQNHLKLRQKKCQEAEDNDQERKRCCQYRKKGKTVKTAARPRTSCNSCEDPVCENSKYQSCDLHRLFQMS